MKIPIQLGQDRTIVLLASDNIDNIDMDSISMIDYSNLYGEAVTCSALLNRIGQLKADAEAIYSEAKLDANIFEASLRKQLRREALLGRGCVTVDDESVKLTEKALDELILLNKEYQALSKKVIYAKRDLDYLESLNWAISSKDRKLNNLLPKVTPDEFFDNIIEGSINTFVIKKMR